MGSSPERREPAAQAGSNGAGEGRSSNIIRDVVASYDDWVIRIYSLVRFSILRQVFLEEIGQYLPRRGRVLDVGCGFGLFSLYFAARESDRSLLGVDVNQARIGHAKASAKRLGLENVEYRVADATGLDTEGAFDAIYLLDLIHHLPRRDVPDFVQKLAARMKPGGILLVKEVEDRPAWKRLFTLALDRLMVGREPIYYWSPEELIPLLERAGFQVVIHRMKDFLPYPHILYVCRFGPT